MSQTKPVSAPRQYFDATGVSVEDQVPNRWFVAFRARTSHRWLGRFDHVSCFGWVDEAQMYVFFETAGDRTWLRLVPADVAEGKMEITDRSQYDGGDIGYFAACGPVIAIDVVPGRRPLPGQRFVSGHVAAVARLIGLPSLSVRPDGFFQDCIRAGAVVVNENLNP
ncbi:hypothetical protein FVA81_24055 [Rhizobium sp. WL3]|uniref:hypothetical protein n=1 Tax=Rhizobium sp. WL3 TaxID=2603277 RepID=UPI0011C204F4|nr:hypothetical protein [Rhizobium sp. WL3]QEE47490.1 hypothetical protein FVA81_24055 [Rhizobium sp. WL3]